MTLLTINTVLFYYPKIVQINFFKTFIWLTLIAVHLTEYSLLASIYAGKYTYSADTFNSNGENESIFDWKVIANLLNGATVTVNFVVTVLSWPMVMPFILASDKYSFWRKIDQSLIHAVPFVLSMINTFLLSDAVIYYSDSWLILVMAALYLAFTYYYT